LAFGVATSVKVLDLQCSQLHVFEGWFASEDDFQSQLTRGLVSCPLCGDSVVTKKLSAPRLNLSTSATPQEVAAANHSELAQLQSALLTMARHVVANTTDVGDRFPEEARKMHYGETEHRNIRGQATPEETEALIDEGIAVMPLPLPESIKEPLQ
jgi:hypothetical protein